MKTVIISQARMSSTRLPGKVLKEVLGKPLLEYHIERLKRTKKADDIVIATTVNAVDEPIVELCQRLNVLCYRGSEDDVLSRYYYAACEARADIVVRVTSDCPLIDSEVVDKVIDTFITCDGCDYVSNTLVRTYPRGMDTEVFSFVALEQAFKEATATPEREHVTPYIYNHPELFKLKNVVYITDQSRHRCTVDTSDDFRLIEKILLELYPDKPDFTVEDVLAVFDRHSDWYYINAHVEQKKF
ncbi:8-amino-3,8-dideoxy-manno-octulosonate cytidylyltransferase [Sporomusa carbonis]|uniref:cytidylyltransferase domain-containing protein n=1 Tax=Sporomusa carbonis TaxID=3076075 RepID=UPI003A70DB6C